MEISRLLRRLAVSGLIATSLWAGSGRTVGAQSAVGQTPTNFPGVSVVAPPPPGYNPVAATPPANTQFALPPAPNAQTAPQAYTVWQRARRRTAKRRCLRRRISSTARSRENSPPPPNRLRDSGHRA